MEPNNLLPSPALAFIFNSNSVIFLANLFASSIIFLSLTACCLIFSARTFLADDVAKIAEPFGIRKFLAYPFLTITRSSLKPTPSTSFFNIISIKNIYFSKSAT